MGEMAENRLDGDDCIICGEYLGGGSGFPRPCAACAAEEKREGRAPGFSRYKVKPDKPKADQIVCPVCRKVVKTAGLGDHIRDKHPETQEVK